MTTTTSAAPATPAQLDALLPDEIDRVAAADHPDPHRVLGPHAGGEGMVVRAFRPDALEVTLVPDDPAIPRRPMRRVHGLGLFEVSLPAAPPLRYRLEVRYATGTFTLRDPYAFAPTLGELDLHLIGEGNHEQVWRHLGAHVREIDGVHGTAFAVWAPTARRVSVAGDFNAWDGRLHAMRRLAGEVWEIFVPDVGEGALYKFEIKSADGALILKSDPYGNAMELRPQTASKVTVRRHEFGDEAWMKARASADPHERPVAIFEVHLGSWGRVPGVEGEAGPGAGAAADAKEPTRWMTYRELADALVDYVADLGFTHVELMPVMEHPYDGSWGYQVSGYYAATARYGSPDDLRYLVDRFHARGIGVILDWVPAHFPKDAAALGRFDGTAVYEHLDPRQGEHRHWDTFIFNFGRPQVKNFLISSALYWLDEFHVDGLRVDAVASMLYLDYSAEGTDDWVPNEFGGRENLAAIDFLRELSTRVHARFPGAILAAEESTTWPGVTRPAYLGGLGFDFKWNMGWMHDTLDYFAADPIYRSFSHRLLTFGLMYAFSERFLLPLSHDEVVHLKKSLLSKMPGDRWKMHANLRALYAYMWAHPGKKLLFMGGEIGQYAEWDFSGELDWRLLSEPDHAGLQRLMRDLNAAYRRYPALWQADDRPEGFTWIDPNDSSQSIASFIRYPKQPPRPRVEPAPPRAAGEAAGAVAAGASVAAHEGTPAPSSHGGVAEPPPPPRPIGPPSRERRRGLFVVFAGNFTPVPRHGYRVGVPRPGRYREIVNTDAREYGGSGMGNLGGVDAQPVPAHEFPFSIEITLPPLACLWLVPEMEDEPEAIAPAGPTAS